MDRFRYQGSLERELQCRAELNRLRSAAIEFYAPLVVRFYNENKKIVLADGSFSKEWKKFDHFSPASRGFNESRFWLRVDSGTLNNRVTLELKAHYDANKNFYIGSECIDTAVTLADVKDGYIVELRQPSECEPVPSIEDVFAAIEQLEQLAAQCKQPYDLIRNLQSRPEFRYDFPRD
jgi:hypothetical protein